MEFIKKVFEGKWNPESDPSRLGPTEHTDGKNIQIMATSQGNAGVLKPLKGTEAIAINVPTGSIHIGTVKDKGNPRVFQFYAGASGDDTITQLDTNTGKTSVVLSMDLGLNPQFLISGGVVGDFLIWSDNNEAQRCINIESAKGGDYAGFDKEDLSLIKQPPSMPLSWAKLLKTPEPLYLFNENSYVFSYRFGYADGEKSVWSIHSKVVPPNWSFNRDTAELCDEIKVTIPITQDIPNGVTTIDFCVYNFQLNRAVEFESLLREDDPAIFDNHPSTPIKAYFKGNDSGTTVALSDFNRESEYIPVTSKAITIASDRVFIGGNNFYLGETVRKQIEAEYTVDLEIAYGYANYIVFKFQSLISGEWQDTGAHYLSSVATTSETGQLLNTGTWDDDNPTETLIPIAHLDSSIFYDTIVDANNRLVQTSGIAKIDTGGTGGNVGVEEFSRGSQRSVGLRFFDKYNRNQGVSKVVDYVVPWRIDGETSISSHLAVLNVTLTGSPLTNIPDWATHYEVVITEDDNKDNVVKKASFINLDSVNGTSAPIPAYITEDDSASTPKRYINSESKLVYLNLLEDGTYEAVPIGAFEHNGVAWFSNPHDYNNYVGIRLEEIPIDQGYEYTQGDLMTITSNHLDIAPITLQVIGVSQGYLILELYDFEFMWDSGYLGISSQMKFEIYQPNTSSEGLYYSTGYVSKVQNSGTSLRDFESTTLVVPADQYVISPLARSQSPRVFTGEPFDRIVKRTVVLDDIPEDNDPNTFVFSEVILSGTKVNGLHNFDAANEQRTPSEDGALTALVIAGRTQSEGTVLLSIGERGCSSIYLGESQISDSTGTVFFSKSDGVVGSINPLKGGFGTQHSESVIEINGRIFFADMDRNALVRYGNNGLYEVSGKSFRQYMAQQVLATNDFITQEALLGDTIHPRFFGAYDENSLEYILTPTFFRESPVFGKLKGSASFENTVGYSEAHDSFTFKLDFLPDGGYINYGKQLFSMNGSNLYKHNVGLPNQFYGVNKKGSIKFFFNEYPSAVKIFKTLAIEGLVKPEQVIFKVYGEYTQETNAVEAEFKDIEGVLYVDILNDINTPNLSGDDFYKMLNGDALRGKFLEVEIIYPSGTDFKIEAVNLGFIPSSGHTV